MKQVAIIFGRFNPPHKGHRVAWERAATIAHWYVGTNAATVGPTDPLPFKIKEQAMMTIYPELKGHLIAEQSWFTMAAHMYAKYGQVELICVTDEAWVVPGLLKSNNQQDRHGYYNFANIRLFHKDVQAAKADMRKGKASDLRAAVLAGDKEAFSVAAGVPADTIVAGHPFFDLVEHYLKPYGAKAEKANAKKLADAEPVNTVEEPRGKSMKKGPAKQLAENRRNYDDNRTGFARRPREDDEYVNGDDDHLIGQKQHRPAEDMPHDVHINGRKWKTFGSHSHATNVAKKIKGATVHKATQGVAEGIRYNRDAYQRDYDSSRTGFGRPSREDDEYVNGDEDEVRSYNQYMAKHADVPHDVYINGKKWKTFGSHSHAHNVAKKIKGASVHKTLEESKTVKAEAPKPRNFVAKNAINTGAGAHKDKKKAAKQGDVKHKKQLEFSEGKKRLSEEFEEMFISKIMETKPTVDQIPKEFLDSAKGSTLMRDIGGYDRIYHLNRIMMATAMADGRSKSPVDMQPHSWYEKYNIAFPYTDIEHMMVNQAMATIPTDGKELAKRSESKEAEDTQKTSPIAKVKRNKYGI